MKPIGKRVVTFIQLIVALALLLGAGALLGEKTLAPKDKLLAKKHSLQKENEQIAYEIRSLEREVMQLRTDPKTVEKVAKKKLGMSRPDETVYMFDGGKKGSAGAINPDSPLNN